MTKQEIVNIAVSSAALVDKLTAHQLEKPDRRLEQAISDYSRAASWLSDYATSLPDAEEPTPAPERQTETPPPLEEQTGAAGLTTVAGSSTDDDDDPPAADETGGAEGGAQE